MRRFFRAELHILIDLDTVNISFNAYFNGDGDDSVVAIDIFTNSVVKFKYDEQSQVTFDFDDYDGPEEQVPGCPCSGRMMTRRPRVIVRCYDPERMTSMNKDERLALHDVIRRKVAEVPQHEGD